MNEEEKKAIEVLEEAKDRLIKPKMLKDVKYTNEDFAKAIETILNLIEKQDNKIKFLLDDEKSLKEMNRNQVKIIERQQKEIEKYGQQIDLEFVEKNFIEKNKVVSKDKIREKLKEIENRRIEEGKCELAIYGFQRDAKIEVLQELLEEN